MTTKPEKEVKYFPNGQKMSVRYKLNGDWHREGGPAYISWHENGQRKNEYYAIKGKEHRQEGPSITCWYGNGNVRIRTFCINNTLHNEEGPARIHWNKDRERTKEEYYIDGEELSSREFHLRKIKKKMEKRI